MPCLHCHLYNADFYYIFIHKSHLHGQHRDLYSVTDIYLWEAYQFLRGSDKFNILLTLSQYCLVCKDLKFGGWLSLYCTQIYSLTTLCTHWWVKKSEECIFNVQGVTSPITGKFVSVASLIKEGHSLGLLSKTLKLYKFKTEETVNLRLNSLLYFEIFVWCLLFSEYKTSAMIPHILLLYTSRGIWRKQGPVEECSQILVLS